MISKVEEETLHLSVLDQNAARCYIQTLQIFPFPDDSQIQNAVDTLAKALRNTLTALPFLAGTIGPADAETGKLSLKYPTSDYDVLEAGLFASKILDHPYTYTQLKRMGMPPSAFTGKVFCPDVLRDRPGIPPYAEGLTSNQEALPVLAVQACFLTGGLVLSIYLHHSVVDCSGVCAFWRQFASNVHAIARNTQLDGKSCVTIRDQSRLRMELDDRIPVLGNPTADAYVREKFLYKHTLPPGTACSAKLFVVPAARIRAFRDKLKECIPNGLQLTICNVLTALVWIHVTRARAKRVLDAGYSKSSLGIAVDSRRRMKPPVTEDHMGPMALFAKATLPIVDFLSEEPVTEELILSTAIHIKQTIQNVDNDWVQRHLAFFQSKTPISDTEPALRFRFGPDIYVTSWMNFGADIAWGIPGTASDAPEFIRRTADFNSDGGIIILPRRRAIIDGHEAPYEILVRLAREDMNRLEAEEGGLRSWTERVIE
ncbi:uncharacterized protein EI97DRAFT_282490 [Westerdykella ornata]|uniref:Trichothecene 3-O-acetyltransferas-like protein n=1 Tax=Westerdykella ornata TaxID=318751 RepID=A0A6A6JN47_WESOR|nr:uncharacterized protein EI97DRAFT_282490 [Westerdykella ornata]KAF2278060.1 hypothetical protein EI97DRAFT_282490 [Westerdykella ornata]